MGVVSTSGLCTPSPYPAGTPVPWGGSIPGSCQGLERTKAAGDGILEPEREGEESWWNFNQLPKQTEARGGNELPAPTAGSSAAASPQRGGRAGPRAPVLSTHVITGTGAPEQYWGPNGKSPLPSCSGLTPGAGVCSAGTALVPATMQREPSAGSGYSSGPLDMAFATVGNGFSEGFVCQRRKLGWNLQEESLKGTAKNYISFPERASSCAGAQRRVLKQCEPEACAKVISGEGSLLREKFSNSHNQLPAYVYS